jgi:hypothetical protein
MSMGRGDRHKVRWAHDRERKKKAREVKDAAARPKSKKRS